MSDKKTCSVWSPRFVAAAGISLGVFFACLYAVIQITGENPKAYISAVVLSALCFLLVFYLLGRTSLAARPALLGAVAPGKVPVLRILIFAAYAALVFVMDRNTATMLGKSLTPVETVLIPSIFLLAAIVPAVFLLWLFRREKPGTPSAPLRYAILTLAAAGGLLCAWVGYKPNAGIDCYDYAAYWENVAALYSGSCFSMVAKSYYGHYALFMLPFFKLVGLNAVTAAVTQAIGNLIFYTAAVYCVFKITRSSVLRICGILGAVYFPFITCNSLYPQACPHRLLFPALMMALGVRAVTGKTPPRMIFALGYLAAVLAILWNLETGLVVLVAWALLYFLHSWYSRTGRARWLRCAAAVLSVPAGFFVAWQSISIINQVLLGSWERMSLRDFIFPLFTAFIEGIQAQLDFAFSHWVAAAIFLLLCLYIGLRDLVQGHSSPRRLLVVYLSAMGLMNALYFFNRVTYENLRLAVYYPALLLILLLMDRAGKAFRVPGQSVREELKAGVFAGHMYGFALLLVLAAAAFPSLFTNLRGYQDTASLDCIPRALEEAGVPADTILYTEYESFIDFTSDKYAYTVMSLVNSTTTAQYLLGQELLAARHPFLVSTTLWGMASASVDSVNEHVADWFAGLTQEKAWNELYEPPREITVRVKDVVRDDTERFFLFMPRT